MRTPTVAVLVPSVLAGALLDRATYLDLYRIKKDKKMLQPTIDVVERLKKETGNEVAKHGITWWWCDALFMAPPTLAKLGNITGDRSYLDLNDRFFKETYDLLYDPTENLYARDAGYLINAKAVSYTHLTLPTNREG